MQVQMFNKKVAIWDCEVQILFGGELSTSLSDI